VPIFDDLPASLESTQKARSTVKQVWDLIISDLKLSAQMLQGKVWTNNDKEE